MTNDLKKQLRADNFVHNNGQVLVALNVLHHSFIKLVSIRSAMERRGISEGEFLDCIHFLSRDGYIEMREIGSKRPIPSLVDHSYKDLEALLSNKGIRLMMGEISDAAIET